VLYSAFGYQGQKCSACSRLIVVDKVYDRFVPKLVEAAKKLKIGPAEDPLNDMGPVIDQKAHDEIRRRLDQYGVFDKQLFPDLDGIAKWLKYRVFEINGTT